MFISDDLCLGAFWDLTGRSHVYTMAEELIMWEAGMNVAVNVGRSLSVAAILFHSTFKESFYPAGLKIKHLIE